jgi:2-polyprenyl-6-methoxyphenol hydroxylase-like FAD-dependent oxidoreductase
MAIEDAVVLAKSLRDESDVEEAFRRYEHARRQRVERVVAQGKRSGDGKTPGPFGRVVRDAALRLIFSRKQTRNPWAFLDENPVRWTGPVADSHTFGSTHHG